MIGGGTAASVSAAAPLARRLPAGRIERSRPGARRSGTPHRRRHTAKRRRGWAECRAGVARRSAGNRRLPRRAGCRWRRRVPPSAPSAPRSAPATLRPGGPPTSRCRSATSSPAVAQAGGGQGTPMPGAHWSGAALGGPCLPTVSAGHRCGATFRAGRSGPLRRSASTWIEPRAPVRG